MYCWGYMIRFLIILIFPVTLFANSESSFIIPLWDGTPPNHQASDYKENRTLGGNMLRVTQVQTPSIEVRLPSKGNSTGTAIVVCPGGGYGMLAYDWEGTDIASWLNANGIAAIVLKYRLPEDASNVTPHLTPLLDAERAMRLARHNASEWNIDADQIGVMGFSAGGHLASTLGTHFDSGNLEASDPVDRLSSRPDFMILMYPVITFDETLTHGGSRRNLLGEDDSPELVKLYSNELHVTPSTPPTFLVHSSDDTAVPVQNSLLFYNALLQNKVEAEMHLYPYGGHGYSLAIGQGRLQEWSDHCIAWIEGLE